MFGLSASGQKSKVIAAFQLIETEKFEEAKDAVEEALQDDRTKNWYRTWHAKGLLCQKAYEKGKEAKPKDKDKYELYLDQLLVAYESYEKAQALDTRGRINGQLAPNYVLMANELRNSGEKYFREKNYAKALKVFEVALQINMDPILDVKIDSNLIYNTALAAYESNNIEKALEYLNELNESKYSPNIPVLLHTVYMEQADTTAAIEILKESIGRYKDNEDLILLLADVLVDENDPSEAIEVLDRASNNYPSKYIFPYTKGLIYQRFEEYPKSIESFKKAYELSPDHIIILSHIGTSYYNMGVEIEENARTITNNKAYLVEKEKAEEAFDTAVKWLEKAYDKNPDNQKVAKRLYELYRILGTTNKLGSQVP